MGLRELVKKFTEQVGARDIFGAMRTAAEILNMTAGTGEALFGASAPEDLTAEESDLTLLCYDFAEPVAAEVTTQTTPAGVDPSTILALVQIILRIIAERKK